MNPTLFEQELSRHSWNDLRQSSEKWRQDVPEILREIAAAASEDDASASYFQLEGACFPQRLVTQSCIAVVSCLMAALAGNPVEHVRGWILEALRGIVCGEPVDIEVAAGNLSLMSDCVEAAREGLWLLLGLLSEVSGPDFENLQAIVSVVDGDRGSRLSGS